MTFDQSYTLMILLGFLLMISSQVGTLIAERRLPRLADRRDWWSFWLMMAGGVLVVAAAAWELRGLVSTFAAFVARSSAAQHTGFTVAMVLLGFGLFALRKWGRLAYGFLEIAVAVIGLTAYPVAPDITVALNAATATWGLGLMSLIYIFVRGLDNVDTALIARRVSHEDRAR